MHQQSSSFESLVSSFAYEKVEIRILHRDE